MTNVLEMLSVGLVVVVESFLGLLLYELLGLLFVGECNERVGPRKLY